MGYRSAFKSVSRTIFTRYHHPSRLVGIYRVSSDVFAWFILDAYWDVEYDHMTFFNRHRYSGHDSFKTLLSKARRKKVSL